MEFVVRVRRRELRRLNTKKHPATTNKRR